MEKLLIVSSLLVLTSACTGLSSVAKQLKNDPAVVTVQIKTIYGSGYMVRDGRANGATTVSMDGAMTSTSGPNSNFRPWVPNAITPETFADLVRKNSELAKQILGLTNQTQVSTNQ